MYYNCNTISDEGRSSSIIKGFKTRASFALLRIVWLFLCTNMNTIKELQSNYIFPRNKWGQIEWVKLFGYVPREECVYGIYHKDKLVYIGTTDNFYTRLKRHFASSKKLEFSKYLLDNFSDISFEVLHPKKSFKIERELISIYQPIFNY